MVIYVFAQYLDLRFENAVISGIMYIYPVTNSVEGGGLQKVLRRQINSRGYPVGFMQVFLNSLSPNN